LKAKVWRKNVRFPARIDAPTQSYTFCPNDPVTEKSQPLLIAGDADVNFFRADPEHYEVELFPETIVEKVKEVVSGKGKKVKG